MQTINSAAELKAAIHQTERQYAARKKSLEEELGSAFSRMARGYAIKNAAISILTAPGVLNFLTAGVSGLRQAPGTGKRNSRETSIMFRRILAIIIQYGISRLITRMRRK